MTQQPKSSGSAIGQILGQARRGENYTVRQVSRALRLPRSVIESIENDRLDDLAPIYRRGYVLNYARHVGADVEQVRELLAIHDDQPPELRQVLPTRHFAWRFESLIRGATYVLVSTVIVLPLVWFFVEGGARVFESGEPEVTRGLVAGADSGGEPRRVSQRIADALALEESPDRASEPGHLNASTMPLNVLKQPRDARVDAEAGEAPLLIDEAGSAADSGQGWNEGGIPGPLTEQRLMLELDEESWVEIRDAAGTRIEYDLLGPGRHIYRGQPPFDVLLGRARTARVEIDGKPADLGGYGNVELARFQVLADGRIRD